MDGTNSLQSPSDGMFPSRPLREILRNAIRYWEPRRILYNLVLASIVFTWIIWSWPHFREALTQQHALILLMLTALANLCYCAAYLADIPMQHSLPQSMWLRWRWTLWLVGMLVAILITNYWIADEIYPYVN